jgi:hypothetical protein
LQLQLQQLQQALAAQQTTAQQNPAAPAPAAITPKRKGVIRIGVLLPSIMWQQAEGEVMPPSIAEDIRTLTIGFLTGETVETIPITARIAQLAVPEAKKYECDALLAVNLQRTPGKSKAGMFSALRAATVMVPGLGTLNRGVMVGTQVATAAASAAEGLASSTRPKDTMTFRYDLTVPGGAALATGQSQAKAEAAGQDLLTPIVTAMAEAVVKKLVMPQP